MISRKDIDSFIDSMENNAPLIHSGNRLNKSVTDALRACEKPAIGRSVFSSIPKGESGIYEAEIACPGCGQYNWKTLKKTDLMYYLFVRRLDYRCYYMKSLRCDKCQKEYDEFREKYYEKYYARHK